MPTGVPATAVSEAGNMPDEDLAGSERVAVGTSRGRPGDPPAVRRPLQIAQHGTSLVTHAWVRAP